jgi:hypothetical protein
VLFPSRRQGKADLNEKDTVSELVSGTENKPGVQSETVQVLMPWPLPLRASKKELV